jgi:hypothetical protein
MEQQFTLRLPAVMAQRLARVSAQTRRPRAEVVRLALEQFLEGEGSRPPSRAIDLVRDLIGTYTSGVPDLGQRHREYLLRRLRRDRSTPP